MHWIDGNAGTEAYCMTVLEMRIEAKGVKELHLTLNELYQAAKRMNTTLQMKPHPRQEHCKWNLIATVVHSFAQQIARRQALTARNVDDVINGIALFLTFCEEHAVDSVFEHTEMQLDLNEVALLYALLLATPIAQLDPSRVTNMWSFYLRTINCRNGQPIGILEPTWNGKTATAAVYTAPLLALVTLLYQCKDGALALFPHLFEQLQLHNLDRLALATWKATGGQESVWQDMIQTLLVQKIAFERVQTEHYDKLTR